MGAEVRLPTARTWRVIGAGIAAAWIALCATTAEAQADPALDARSHAVRQIMTQLELVELDLGSGLTARSVFQAAPALREAAEEAVWKAASTSAVATLPDGGTRVDVVVMGAAVQDGIEQAAKAHGLPASLQGVSFEHIGTRGRRYSATGRAGHRDAVPAPWARVSDEDRALAVAAARLQALTLAAAQLAELASRRGLDGAPDLAAVIGESEWVRAHEARFWAAGARELMAPRFVDDGTVVVQVELPAAVLFAVLRETREAPTLPAGAREALARGLWGTAGTGLGRGRAPGESRLAQRPRLLWAEGSGKPAAESQGPRMLATARQAAEQVARGRLMEQLRRVPLDARRTVGDWLRQHPEAETAVGRFVAANARQIESRAVGTTRWYIKLELNLDGLDAALR